MAKNQFSTIIFDLDGTLFYTSDDIANCANLTLERFGFEKIDKARIISHVGGGIHNSISRILGDAIHNDPEYVWKDGFVDKVVKEYRDFYSKHFLDTTRPYPGVAKTVERLYDQNYRMAVISNKSVDYTKAIIKHFDMDQYFPIILGGDSLENKKPHPQSINFVMDQFNTLKNESLIVGDTEKDIQAGKNAEIKTCAVSYGMRDIAELQPLDPDYVINKFDELNTILKSEKIKK